MELFRAVFQISALSKHDLGYQLSRRYDLYEAPPPPPVQLRDAGPGLDPKENATRTCRRSLLFVTRHPCDTASAFLLPRLIRRVCYFLTGVRI
jgi:hypothetical protein